MKIQIIENQNLKKYNTFGLEVHAKFFCTVETTAQLEEALVFAQSNNLEQLIQTFIEKINNATGQQTQGIQDLMNNTTTQLTQLIENLNQSGEQMKYVFNHITTKAASNMNEMYTKQQDALQQQYEVISQESNNITSSMRELLENLTQQSLAQEKRTEKVANNFEELHEQLLNSNRTFMDEIENKNKLILDDITQKMTEVQSIINISAEKLQLLPYLLGTFEQGSKNLQVFAQKTEEATKEFTETVNHINQLQELLSQQAHSSQSTIENLNKTSQTTLEMVEKVHSSVEDINSVYNNVIDENKHNLEELGQSMSKWLQEYDSQTHATMQNSLNEVQAALSNFANTLSQSIASLEDAIESINDKLA
jgi:chromosome segregation ATPase